MRSRLWIKNWGVERNVCGRCYDSTIAFAWRPWGKSHKCWLATERWIEAGDSRVSIRNRILMLTLDPRWAVKTWQDRTRHDKTGQDRTRQECHHDWNLCPRWKSRTNTNFSHFLVIQVNFSNSPRSLGKNKGHYRHFHSCFLQLGAVIKVKLPM
jgi:hypothetical protein